MVQFVFVVPCVKCRRAKGSGTEIFVVTSFTTDLPIQNQLWLWSCQGLKVTLSKVASARYLVWGWHNDLIFTTGIHHLSLAIMLLANEIIHTWNQHLTPFTTYRTHTKICWYAKGWKFIQDTLLYKEQWFHTASIWQ